MSCKNIYYSPSCSCHITCLYPLISLCRRKTVLSSTTSLPPPLLFPLHSKPPHASFYRYCPSRAPSLLSRWHRMKRFFPSVSYKLKSSILRSLFNACVRCSGTHTALRIMLHAWHTHSGSGSLLLLVRATYVYLMLFCAANILFVWFNYNK